MKEAFGVNTPGEVFRGGILCERVGEIQASDVGISGVAALTRGCKLFDAPTTKMWGLCPLPWNLSGLTTASRSKGWPRECRVTSTRSWSPSHLKRSVAALRPPHWKEAGATGRGHTRAPRATPPAQPNREACQGRGPTCSGHCQPFRLPR